MLQSASLLQRWPMVRTALHGSWAYENVDMLSQTIQGLHFRNPIGLSAGFDKNFELPPMMRAIGFGFMEGGSVTSRPCAGNPRPWFHRLPRSKSLVVHAGLANQGVEVIAARIQAYAPKLIDDFPLNISVAQTNAPHVATEDDAIQDIVDCLRHVQRSGVGRMVTINISCPNTYNGEPFTSPGMFERLLKEVDTLRLQQPVFIKMPNHLPWRDVSKLLTVAKRHDVSGVTVSNLAKREAGVQLADPLPDSVRGGLSGKPTWEKSNELIKKTYQHYGDRFIIIGVGGVFSAEDAYTKIRLGASLVELITGMVFEGPQLIGQINKGLAALLERDGFANVSEAIGVDAR
jgi:dihydroorotate dehydrogenase